MLGKGLKDPNNSTAGSVALAMHVRSVAKYYGIPVILHSDHCAKKLLPWYVLPKLLVDGSYRSLEVLIRFVSIILCCSTKIRFEVGVLL